ncbi:MAG: hypothetical protein V3V40_06555 [Nitrosomonadaceae bacterium]
MAKEVLVDSQQNTLVDTPERFFTAPSGGGDNGVEITAFTATNNTTSNVTYIAYIYRLGVPEEAIVPLKILVRDSYDLAPAAVGQKLNPGDELWIESSAVPSAIFNVTGNSL